MPCPGLSFSRRPVRGLSATTRHEGREKAKRLGSSPTTMSSLVRSLDRRTRRRRRGGINRPRSSYSPDLSLARSLSFPLSVSLARIPGGSGKVKRAVTPQRVRLLVRPSFLPSVNSFRGSFGNRAQNYAAKMRCDIDLRKDTLDDFIKIVLSRKNAEKVHFTLERTILMK